MSALPSKSGFPHRACLLYHRKRTLPLPLLFDHSSARFCTDCGTAMPSVFAVLRLRSSSILLACWTGKSAGFSPLRKPAAPQRLDRNSWQNPLLCHQTEPRKKIGHHTASPHSQQSRRTPGEHSSASWRTRGPRVTEAVISMVASACCQTRTAQAAANERQKQTQNDV